MYSEIAYGLLLPFVGTTLGAAMVFFLRGEMVAWLQKLLLGFASGVMIAASVWSLLIPSINMSAEMGMVEWMPAVLGFLAGMFSLLLFDSIVPHIHLDSTEPEGVKSGLGRSSMLVMAVTLHNIPEGMAVGVVLAGALTESAGITLMGALALSIGIAIQNFPEGAIISLPLAAAGERRAPAFFKGVASAVVETLGAVLALVLTSIFLPILPYLLGFAAGAMIYVVVEELIPESSALGHSNLVTVFFSVGFLVMMILDVVLG